MAIICDCTGIGDSLRVRDGTEVASQRNGSCRTGSEYRIHQVNCPGIRYRTDGIVTTIIQGGDRPGLSPEQVPGVLKRSPTATAVTEATWQLSVTAPASVIAFVFVMAAGLHPSGIEAEGQDVNTGSTRSTVQVYVTVQIASLPQSSRAVTVQD
jgi:hypothetical protein